MDAPNRTWMIVVAALLLATPLWFLLWCGDSFNDKLYGWHAAPVGYGIIGLAALAAAAVVWGMVRVGVPPDLRGRTFWPLVGLVGCFLVFSFCLGWGRLLTEYRDHQGRPTIPPLGDRR
jgi:hypothetical protein